VAGARPRTADYVRLWCTTRDDAIGEAFDKTATAKRVA